MEGERKEYIENEWGAIDAYMCIEKPKSPKGRYIVWLCATKEENKFKPGGMNELKRECLGGARTFSKALKIAEEYQKKNLDVGIYLDFWQYI